MTDYSSLQGVQNDGTFLKTDDLSPWVPPHHNSVQNYALIVVQFPLWRFGRFGQRIGRPLWVADGTVTDAPAEPTIIGSN